MPFLLVKRHGEAWPVVDEKALVGRLCPYTGPITRADLGEFRLYFSSLGARREDSFVFPAQTRFEPHGAWARVSRTGEIQTDPMGQVPLWRHETPAFTAWAPEAKAFAAIAGVTPLWKDDAAILAVEPRDRTFSPFTNLRRELPAGLAAPCVPVPTETGPEEAIAALAAALATSASDFALEDEVGAFLSGGIDSSTATALLQRRRPGFPVFTLGTAIADEYADAADLATHLGLRPVRVPLAGDELLALWSRVIFMNEAYDGMSAEILLQIAALCQAAEGQIITGYGSDLIFGSMLGHEAYLDAVGVRDTAGLVERTRWSTELSPFCAWAAGVRQVHLYWHPAVLTAAMRIPTTMQRQDGVEKVILREAAVQQGWLLRAHAYRPKLGMTLGTGVNRLLSAQLGLPDPYAYAAKSADALQRLKRAIASGSPA
jgi:asparagine synthetase B (glutamine-hydrolysing)